MPINNEKINFDDPNSMNSKNNKGINYDVISNVLYSGKKLTEDAKRKVLELQTKAKNILATTPSNKTIILNGKGFKANGSGGKTSVSTASTVSFDANAAANSLGKLDIITELPKLTVNQIEAIISKHYSNSKVISPSDAQAIYNAQNSSGISALVTLGIGALESGWGTSNIANKTNNIWGYGATNDNPEGNAHKYSSMEDAALRYSNSLKKDYYDGYGAKTIYAIGTGNNPSGKGYAYNNDGTISTTWYNSVNSILGTLYNTAKSAQSQPTSGETKTTSTNGTSKGFKVNGSVSNTSGKTKPTSGTPIVDIAKKYLGTPYVWGGKSMDAGGMDCSGFVYNVLKDAGYNVGITNSQGYRAYGTAVSKSDMQVGDMIFYGKNNKASHMGIYIGNGQIIHSSGGTANTKANPGKGVIISNVGYRSDLLEVRRF